MARTTRRHLPPQEHTKRRRPKQSRELSKPAKQIRANERAALRKEHR